MSIDLIDTARPKNSGTFPIAYATDIKGGLHTVDDATARLAIPAARRVVGMFVYQTDTDEYYRLNANLTDWTLVVFNAATADIVKTIALDGLQAALDSSPRDLYKYGLRINMPAGNATGALFTGFIGGRIDLAGTWATPTVASGLTSFTAGTGTGSDTINKQTGAANWPNDGSLVGKMVRVTGGSGFLGSDAFDENIGLIRSHNASQLFIDQAMYGIDNTSQIEIVEPGTVINSASPILDFFSQSFLLGFRSVTSAVRVRRIKLDGTDTNKGLYAEQAQWLDFSGCWFFNCANYIQYCGDSSFIVITYDNSFTYHYRIGSFFHYSSQSNDSGTFVSRFTSADIWSFRADGDSASGSALQLEHGNEANVGGTFDNATHATPVVAHNVNNFSLFGTIDGSNPGTQYAFRFDGGGQCNIAGMTVTASDANSKYVLFENGLSFQYAQLAANGAIELNGSWILWAVGSVVHLAGTDVFTGARQFYGVDYYVGEAYNAGTYIGGALASDFQIGSGEAAHTSPSLANAKTIAFKKTFVTAAAADGDAIKFFGNTAPLTGMTIGYGMDGVIYNTSGHSLALYPHVVGKRIWLNGVAQSNGAAVTFANQKKATYAADNNGDWHVEIS